MKVNGIRTISEVVSVDVDPNNVVNKLIRNWWVQNFPVETKNGWYINKENHWEECTEYYHGSDSYTDHGPAPIEAINANNNFKFILQVAKEFK